MVQAPSPVHLGQWTPALGVGTGMLSCTFTAIYVCGKLCYLVLAGEANGISG